MPHFEPRRKKDFSDEVISEMVREISQKILLKNEFGLTYYKLFQKVSRMVFEKTKGYMLTSSHFILSLHKLSGREMMSLYDPFASNCVFGEIKIYHKSNLKKINKIVEDVYHQSRIAQ